MVYAAYCNFLCNIFITGIYVINVASHSLLDHEAITPTKPSEAGHTVTCTSTAMRGIKTRRVGGEEVFVFVKIYIVSHSRAANTLHQQTLTQPLSPDPSANTQLQTSEINNVCLSNNM